MADPRFVYRAVISGPTGEPLLWTVSPYASQAKRLLLGRLGQWLTWEFAQRQGYKLSWVKDVWKEEHA